MVFNLMKRLKNWHTYFIRMYNENPKLPDTNSHCDLSTKPEIGRSDNESTISNNIILFLCILFNLFDEINRTGNLMMTF